MRYFLILFSGLASLGCSLHAALSGVLVQSNDQTQLMGDDGREWRLIPGDHSAVLDHAAGVSIQLNGVRVGRTLWVDSWRITDGGDGSAPFVGNLRRLGVQWMIDDLNSGSTVVLVEESLGDLREHEGQVVMVSGYVVGAHRVNVVRWSLLE